MKKIIGQSGNKARRIFFASIFVMIMWIAYHFVHAFLIPDVKLNYSQEDLKLLKKEESTENYYIKEQQAYFDNAMSVNRQYTTSEFSLSSGTYEIKVSYDAVSDDFSSYVYSHSGAAFHNLISDQIVLRKADHSICYQIEVKHSLSDVQIRFNCPDNENIQIHSISIERTRAADRMFICNMIILLIMVCMVYKIYVFYQSQRLDREQIGAFFFLTMVAFCSSILLFREGMVYGDDMPFHLWRIEGIKEGLLNGEFPVRLHALTIHGAGYAAPLYYGEILLYIPAVLRIIGYSVETAYKVFVIIINFATVFSAYYCLVKIFQRREFAALGSTLYAFAIYRLTDIYVRAAVGEYCAMVFIPVVCYAFWNIYHKKDTELKKNDYLPMVVGLTGLLQTHILMTILAAIAVLVFVCISYKKTFQKYRFIILMKSVLYTVLLNAWFIVPFLCSYFRERLVINARGEAVQYIQNEGLSLLQMISTTYHEQSGGEYSRALGVEVILLLSVAVFWMLYILSKNKNEQRDLWRAGKICSILAVLCMLAGTDLIPYNFIFEEFTLFNKIFGMIQFPWRFLTFTNLLLALEWVIVFCILKERMQESAYWVAMSILVIITVMTGIDYMGELSCNKQIVHYQDTASLPVQSIMAISAGEYLPVDTNQNEFIYSDREIWDDSGVIQEYLRKDNYFELKCINREDREVYCEVALLYYRNYIAYDKETGRKFNCYAGNNSRVCVEVPGDYEGTICIKYQSPWYWRLAEWISVVSCVGMIGYPVVSKRFHRRKCAE